MPPAASAVRPSPLRHRPTFGRVASLILIVLPVVVAASTAHAEPMGAMSLSGGVTVRGTTAIDNAALATALAADDDLLLLSRPLGNRKLFLSALARKTVMALEHRGVATPKATASIEDDGAGGERIVVDVTEGTAYPAGAIEIRGLSEDMTAGLRRWLQSQRPPEHAVGVAVETDDGWAGERWVDADGRDVQLEPPLWQPGKPAPFDAPHLAAIRRAIARYLREQGHHASARLADPPRGGGILGGLTAAARGALGGSRSTLEVAVKPAAEGGTATLVVTGTDLPARSVLRDVTVSAGSRTDRDTLVRALGILLGGPVMERDLAAWRRTLHESGRFVSARVALEDAPHEPDGPPGVVARFDLDDYLPATPFGTPPSREEEVMLRFRAWLGGTLAGDDDLVARWNGAGDLPIDLVLSRRRGLLVAAAAGGADAHGVSVGADGVGCFLPRGAGRFEVPLPRDAQMTLNVSLKLSRKPAVEGEPPAFERNLALGVGFGAPARGAATPFAVSLGIDPVACLAIVHERSPTLSWEGDELVVAGEGMSARFHAPSGRLVGLSTPASTLGVAVHEGRFDAGVGALRASAGDDRADPQALVSSAVAFFTDPRAAETLDQAARATGSGATLDAVSARALPLVGALRRAASRGALESLDRLLAAAMAAAEDPADELPEIPHEKPPVADGLVLAGRFAAARAWRILEQDCGRDSWPAGLVRLATLGLAGDPAVLEELSAYMTAPANGPLAFLAAASGVPMPLVAVTLARRGEERLDATAFRADCRPLLGALEEHDLDLPLAAVLRSLTDEEIGALGHTLAGDPGCLTAPLAVLRGAPSDAAAVAALPDALDAWWGGSLRRIVAARLADLIAPRTAGAPGSGQPVR